MVRKGPRLLSSSERARQRTATHDPSSQVLSPRPGLCCPLSLCLMSGPSLAHSALRSLPLLHQGQGQAAQPPHLSGPMLAILRGHLGRTALLSWIVSMRVVGALWICVCSVGAV